MAKPENLERGVGIEKNKNMGGGSELKKTKTWEGEGLNLQPPTHKAKH